MLGRTGLITLTAKSLVTVGMLVMLFAAFQLWGTGLVEWHAQRDLANELSESLDRPPSLGSHPAPSVASLAGPHFGPGAAEEPQPDRGPAPEPVLAGELAEGTPIGRIEIPAIGVSKVVLEGVARDTLRSGPGHYPGTPLPGWAGNVAIAGHRTTHGAPFTDLDQLQPGDAITIETADGVFTYVVEGHDIVAAGAVEVVGDQGDDRLTLTACHPRYSSRQRIVVTAVLDDPPSEVPPPVISSTAPSRSDIGPDAGGRAAPVASQTIDSFGWQSAELGRTLGWGAVTAAVGWGAALLARRRRWERWERWGRLAVYALTAPIFLAALSLCFVHLDRLLPAY